MSFHRTKSGIPSNRQPAVMSFPIGYPEAGAWLRQNEVHSGVSPTIHSGIHDAQAVG